jgi:hypothetical protein
MSRGFYRMDLCAFAARENEGTLNVMVRAFTRYIDDLGKSRQPLMPKAWHTHENKPHGETDFYPLLAKFGNPSNSGAKRRCWTLRCLHELAGELKSTVALFLSLHKFANKGVHLHRLLLGYPVTSVRQ